jgi:cysteinyl-tRNA synthetase
MEAGARVDVAPNKKGPMDFVLWKPSTPAQPGWPSPCGIATPGRPGWHIECSAMADQWLWREPKLKGLLSQAGLAHPHVFDIHGGGIDLVFPHHENEIAQSRCAHGTPAMANYWMHNGFLQVEGEKMSKSLGNFVTINELLETKRFGSQRWHGKVLRLAMLMTQYRQPIDWTAERLVQARSTLHDWNALCYAAPTADGPSAKVLQALRDDLNTPAAIAAIHQIVAKFHRASDGPSRVLLAGELRSTLSFLGLYQEGPSIELLAQDIDQGFEPKVAALIAARLEARKRKDFKESDRIRDELAAMGIQLKDSKNKETGEIETTWEVKR